MSTNLPSRYWGSVFQIRYAKSEKITETMQDAILITNKDSFYIFSNDWSESICQVSTGQVQEMVRSEEEQDIAITYKISGKPTTHIHLRSKNDKFEKLFKAITVETSKNAGVPQYGTLTNLIPTFKFTMESEIEEFYAALVNMQTRFYANFECDKPCKLAFVDIIACAYRFRYNNEAGQEFKTNVDSFIVEFRRLFFSEWCTALLQAARFNPDEKNAYEYALRLVTSIATDIHVNSDSLEVNSSDLFGAIGEMAERGNATNITEAVVQMNTQFKEAFNSCYNETPCVNQTFTTLLMRVALVLFCGNMLQIYPIDVERFTLRVIDFAVGAFTQNLAEDHFKRLRKAVDSFTNELLRFMDTRRYDPSFRFVFIASVINEEIKRTPFDGTINNSSAQGDKEEPKEEPEQQKQHKKKSKK